MSQTNSYSPNVTSNKVIPQSLFWKKEEEKIILLCAVNTEKLKTGDELDLNGKNFTIQEIQIQHYPVNSASKGQEVGIHLKNTTPENIKEIGGKLLKGRRDH